ncbi:MAG TPA: hypothetical protein VES64_06845 [Allosphingosinicella sp.]|nr:hypothetical protein [Allosphingosinicella sp.]
MKTLAFILAAMSASAALAQPPPPAAAARAERQRPIIVRGPHARLDPNEILCRTQADTGSRLRTQRTCATRAQWAEQRRQVRQDVEKAQLNRTY